MSTAGPCADCDGTDYTCGGCGRLYAGYELPIRETAKPAPVAPVTLWTVVRAALAEHQAIEDDRDADHGGCSCDAYRYTDHTINWITGERYAHPGTATPEDYHAARAWFLDHQTNAVIDAISDTREERRND